MYFPVEFTSYIKPLLEKILLSDGDDGDAAEKKKAVLKEVEILS